MTNEKSKSNSIRKKYLNSDYPLKDHEQKIIDRDLNDSEFTDFKNDSGDKILLPEKYSLDNTFEIVENKIFDQEIHKVRQRRQYLSIAASIAIIFVLSFMFIKQHSEKDVNIIMASTGYGERLEVVLPDSSRVILNSLSSLSYPEKFSKDVREVVLTGEGYFIIQKDKTKPFKVKAEEINVEVLGTVFNIKAYKDEEKIQTTLLEGSIALSYESLEPLVIKPGETVYFNRNSKTLEVDPKDTRDVSAWKINHLIFENFTLESICKILERENNIKIIIEDETLKSFRLTAKFIHNESPKQILEILGNSGKFKSQEEGKNYYHISSNE